MTTNELIKQVLEHDEKATPGPWRKGIPVRTESGIEWVTAGTEIWAEDDGRGDLGPLVVDMDGFTEETDVFLVATYRTAAPLLARKLQLAMEVVAYALDSDGDGMYLSCADIACPKGEPSEHSGHCIVKRAADALREIEAME